MQSMELQLYVSKQYFLQFVLLDIHALQNCLPEISFTVPKYALCGYGSR